MSELHNDSNQQQQLSIIINTIQIKQFLNENKSKKRTKAHLKLKTQPKTKSDENERKNKFNINQKLVMDFNDSFANEYAHNCCHHHQHQRQQ